MELADHVNVTFFSFLFSFFFIFIGDAVEPIVKHFRVGKNFREKEVK